MVCHVALWWGPPVRWLVLGMGPTWVMWSNRGLTRGMLELMWLHTVLPCVSWGPTHCWCVLLWLCHVAWTGVRWTTGWLPRGTVVGPPVRWLVLGWGQLADMDQWEGATWHPVAELAQSDAATWHTLSLLLFCISFVLCTQFVPKTIVVPKLYPELPWLNLSPWLIHFIFSEFILIASLVQKSWNFHQKYLNSWWSLLYF
jgi:hypothetical protein